MGLRRSPTLTLSAPSCDPDRRRDHEHYAITAELCEKYDQASFDPDYPTEPIEVFEPMVRRVFAEPRYLPPGWV